VGRAEPCVHAQSPARRQPGAENAGKVMRYLSCGAVFLLLGLNCCTTAADVYESGQRAENSLRISCQHAEARGDSSAAAMCWADLREEQEIHAQQIANLRAAPDFAAPPSSSFVVPHSAFVLSTTPPAPPQPNPIPNLGVGYIQQPQKVWGQTPCAPFVPVGMQGLPVNSTEPRLPEGCR
jgi:hypothetical protein